MKLQEKIEQEMRSALKAGEQTELSTLRFLMASIQNLAIEKQQELTDEDVVGVIQKQIKQRQESITAFKAGNRLDLAAKESQEIEVLSKYLPEQLSAEELKEIILAVIAELKAGPQDFGKVMSNLMPRVKGRANGALVSQLVKELLS